VSTAPNFEDAELGDVPASSLTTHIPNPLAKDTKNYLVEYGIRVDDDAMVFHFFSPKDKETWDPKYDIHNRLEHAITKCFDLRTIKAGYVSELESFYVIVEGLGLVPDPWAKAEAFFSAIDAAPASS